MARLATAIAAVFTTVQAGWFHFGNNGQSTNALAGTTGAADSDRAASTTGFTSAVAGDISSVASTVSGRVQAGAQAYGGLLSRQERRAIERRSGNVASSAQQGGLSAARDAHALRGRDAQVTTGGGTSYDYPDNPATPCQVRQKLRVLVYDWNVKYKDYDYKQIRFVKESDSEYLIKAKTTEDTYFKVTLGPNDKKHCVKYFESVVTSKIGSTKEDELESLLAEASRLLGSCDVSPYTINSGVYECTHTCSP